MRVVYLDSLFLLNALIDYLLLLASARLAGERLCRGRMLLGGILGGVYAAGAVLPGGGFLSRPACKLAGAVLMVLVGLGGSRRLLRQTIIFFALACAFGGGVLAISLLGGHGLALSGGVIYSEMDVKMVLLSAAGCYGLLTLVLNRVGRHSAVSGELVSVEVHMDGKRAAFFALQDTGNTLTDPVSGRGVIVADWEAVLPLLEGGLHREDLTDPARAVARLNCGQRRGRFRLLPYRAVGVSCGLLLTLRPDRVYVNDRDCGAVQVALSPTPVSDGGVYRALTGVVSQRADGKGGV